jgi:hypothetical protein
MPRSPGGKVLSTKIRCSGGTGAIINPERVSSPIVPFYSDHKKTITAAGPEFESRKSQLNDQIQESNGESDLQGPSGDGVTC